MSVNNLKTWVFTIVTMAHLKGYTPIPIINGKPLPFGNGETYPPNHNAWLKATMVGIRLDSLILVDVDGNKAEDDGDQPPSIEELAKKLGLSSMPMFVQTNGEGNSLHYLFCWPHGTYRQNCRQSADGAYRYIDIKTGNQLMYIKPHKFLTNAELPDLECIPIATEQIINHLCRNNKTTGITKETKRWGGDPFEITYTRALLMHIPPAEDYATWIDVLMRMHDKFGYCDECINLCDEWSSRAKNYGGRELVKQKLASFSWED